MLLHAKCASYDAPRSSLNADVPQAICIIGGSDGTAPSELRAFTNRDDLDFAAVADLSPVQCWDLQDNSSGQLEYPTQCVPQCFASLSAAPSICYVLPSTRCAP